MSGLLFGAAPPPEAIPTAVTPTAEQDAAIGFAPQPLRIIAGAGTGKTMVMVERIAHLVATGQATADQVLGLTFTNKAAGELKQRVETRLGADADVMVTTYHGMGAGLVARHLLELDLHPRTRLLNRAEAWQLLFLVFDEFRFDKKRVFRPGIVVNDALTLASHCADHLVDIADVAADARTMATDARWKASRETAEGRFELCQIVAAYEREKRRRHLMDFDDQIRLAVVLLRDRPDLARRLSGQRPFVLLDEYQDTNFAQRILLQTIYPPGSAITAVGDDMQSIYAFRGAHLRNLLDFGVHFPPAAELALTVNRRSGPAVVDLANRIQAQVKESVPKQLTAREGAPTAVVECFLASDDLEEAATIAADVVAIGPPWSQHAVLCRKRRLIPAIAAALETAAVPVEVVGSSGLLDRPEVIDLVAWLELLADPASAVALLRILGGPRYRLGRRDLAALARQVSRLRGSTVGHDTVAGPAMVEPATAEPAMAETQAAHWGPESVVPVGLADALGDLDSVEGLSPRARARLSRLMGEWDDLARAARHLPVVELAEVVTARTGLWSAVGERGQENLLRFLKLAEEFAPVEGVPGLAAFVDYLHLLEESDEDVAEAHPGDTDAVSVMTIHQAKGLEWDHVWVPGLAGSSRSRIFPDERGGDNPLTKQTALPWWLCEDNPGFGDWKIASKDSIDRAVRQRAREEEWRLLYVACTRARRRLVCSAAQWYAGPASPQGPSEFYAFISGQSDLVHERFRHDPPDTDPKVSQMRARQAAVTCPPGATGSSSHASSASPTQPSLFDHPASRPRLATAPDRVSVTELVSYRRCPRQYYWLVVRPLPRRASAAARLGTAAHRWIEQRAANQLGLFGLMEAAPEAASADPGELAVGLDEALGGPSVSGAGGPRSPSGSLTEGPLPDGSLPDGALPDGTLPDRPASFERALAGLQAAFLATPFAALDPQRVEAPFVLSVNGTILRGRIDAAYQRDGRLEVVDFKTGRPPEDGDPGASVQLDTYAVAAVEVWSEDPAALRTTYCYLTPDGGFHLVSSDWTPDRVAIAQDDIAMTLGRLGHSVWTATPGPWCRRCEWREVCRAGQAFLSHPASPGGAEG